MNRELWKKGIQAAAALMICAAVTGCLGKPGKTGVEIEVAEPESARLESTEPEVAEPETPLPEDAIGARSEEICADIEINCKKIHETFLGSGEIQSLERMEQTLDRLEKAGYSVIDQDNQFDLRNMEPVKEFCTKVTEKQEGTLWLVTALNNGNFVLFYIETDEGNVDVLAESLFWRNGGLVIDPVYTDRFRAETWKCTENGYLFFEKPYMAGFSGPYGHVAVRIEPLDRVCREMNRSYILPLGYGANNLFLTDWTETDYGEVNFYDLFERLYGQCGVDITEYMVSEAEAEDVVCQIPAETFERVILSYFSISREELRKRTKYNEAAGTYEYRPRGFYDAGSGAELPYPEVTGYEERVDGTVELTVNSVWPEGSMDFAFRHRVVVRPVEDGKFQFVSNHVDFWAYQRKDGWYVERMGVKN